MGQTLTAVPYPRTDGKGWGIICPDHPTRGGGNTPTDYERSGAEAFAEAVVCNHPSHQGIRLQALDVPAFLGKVAKVLGTPPRHRFGRVRQAFFADHPNAGMVEVGFLDGTIGFVPFAWALPIWPVPEELNAIPVFPDAPDAHKVARRSSFDVRVLRLESEVGTITPEGDAWLNGYERGWTHANYADAYEAPVTSEAPAESMPGWIAPANATYWAAGWEQGVADFAPLTQDS